MAKRRKNQFSYPKAIAIVAVLCGFVMAKFQSPNRHSHHFKRQGSTQRSTARSHRASHNEIKGSVLEGSTVGNFSVGNGTETNSIPKQTLEKAEFVKPKQINCFSNFQKLAANAPTQETIKSDSSHVKRTKKASISIARKKVATREVKIPTTTQVVPQWVEGDLEKVDSDNQDALDNPAPLDGLAQTAFNEPSMLELTESEPLIAAFQWSDIRDLDFPFKPEFKMYAQESEFQKSEFEDVRGVLVNLQGGLSTLSDIQAPDSKVAWNNLEIDEKGVSSEELLKAEGPKVAMATQVENKEFSSLGLTSGVPEVSENDSRGPEVQEAQSSDEIPSSEVKTTLEASNNPPSNETQQATSLSPVLGAAAGSVPELLARAFVPSIPGTVNTQKSQAGSILAQNQVSTQQQHSLPGKREMRTQNQNNDEAEDVDASVEGKIYGDLHVDDATRSWMKSRRGHIELYLNRVGSADPQDTIFLFEYQYPKSGPSFELDGTGLKGKYKLVAGIYIPESSVPVAQIPYSKLISPDSWKEKITFVIRRETLESASLKEESFRTQEYVPLNMTLFKGAPGNYRSPKAISNGEVLLVGFPELGSFRTDKDGNIRIPAVPVASEIIVEAKAPGHYPTRQIIPVSSSSAYAPIYLIEKDKVDVVTGFFTKKPQQEDKGIVMGRVYDVKTRTPLAGETLSLSHRRGNAVYFGALPDLSVNATLATGLFGFFNIEPSIRALGRSSEKHPLILNVSPGYGYFLELGRGGSRNLLGRLTDPFANKDVFGTIQMVGGYQEPLATSETGKFIISDLDLPPGVVTLEAFAEGYPRVWYTLPWTTREAEKEKTLYMIERDLIRESSARVARVKHEKNTGVIVGGANTGLFKMGRNRITLVLLDSRGSAVSEEHGPFSLSKTSKTKASFNVTASDPGFAFYNLPPGEYVLHMIDESGSVFRTHVVRVGVERVSVVVN